MTTRRPGILWIAIAFSGTLALGRTFERERQNDTLRALMLAPLDRPALYVGKLVGVLLLLAAVEAVVTPLIALMFHAPLFAFPSPDGAAARRRNSRVHGGGHALRGDARPRA